jgi:hypothetical protein
MLTCGETGRSTGLTRSRRKTVETARCWETANNDDDGAAPLARASALLDAHELWRRERAVFPRPAVAASIASVEVRIWSREYTCGLCGWRVCVGGGRCAVLPAFSFAEISRVLRETVPFSWAAPLAEIPCRLFASLVLSTATPEVLHLPLSFLRRPSHSLSPKKHKKSSSTRACRTPANSPSPPRAPSTHIL